MINIPVFAINFIGGLIPEMVLSLIIMKFAGAGWVFFWLAYISIQVFYLIVWIFRSLIGWLFYRAYWKKQLVEDFYRKLASLRYPYQGYHVTKPVEVEGFFEEIYLEPQLEVETRINAAIFSTWFVVLREVANYQALFRFRRAIFDAVRKYVNDKNGRVDPQEVADL